MKPIMKTFKQLLVGMLAVGGLITANAAPQDANLKYGLCIHYGMPTFMNKGENGQLPAERFAPPPALHKLVRNWARTAKEMGMTFAVLTAKHESGFCLWPAKDYDYSISQSPYNGDILREFIEACKAEDIAPGVHYSIPDAHNEEAVRFNGEVSASYFEVIKKHFEDLHTRYPELRVQVVNGSWRLSPGQLGELKQIVHRLNPECAFWETTGGYEGPHYVTATIVRGWFWQPRCQLCPMQEIETQLNLAQSENKALILNVGPVRRGNIPGDQLAVLEAMKGKIGRPLAAGSVQQAATPKPPESGRATELSPPTSSQTPLETLSQQALNATAWVLAPLDESVPGDIRQNLTALREDLLDEAKANPKAGPEAYAIGRQLCDTLMAALDERDATLVRVGYRAAQANANTRVTSQALEARRNYKMSWPQYAREQNQAAEIFRQQTNNASLTKELPKVEWSNRTAVLRRTLDVLYAKYREALRQGKK
jgi:hypothetical protein